VDHILIYLLLTGVLALLQLREAYATLRTGEKPTRIDWSFAFLEFIWLPVSIAVLYFGTLNQFEAMVPVAYIVLSLYGWLLGYLYYRDVDITEYQVIEIPSLYLVFTLAYCSGLAIYSFLVFYYSLPQRNEIPIQTWFAQHWIIIAAIAAIILLLKLAAARFRKYSLNILNTDIMSAINRDAICTQHLGTVTAIELDDDLSAEYEKDVFAYYVSGEKSDGLLIAKFVTDENDDEHIVEGLIQFADDSIIELEKKTFRA